MTRRWLPLGISMVGLLLTLALAGNAPPTCEPVNPDTSVCMTALECGEAPACVDEATGAETLGAWSCVDATCVLSCNEEPPSCPAEPSIGFDDPSCEAGATCEYGEECCCGVCHPSIVCNCMGGGWGCYYTDACMIPGCPEEPPPPGQCRTGADCDGFLDCLAPGEPLPCGMCMDPTEIACDGDGDCGDGQVCDVFHVGCLCWPADTCGPACVSDADCDAGERCGDTGHCDPILCTAEACPPLFDCGPAQQVCTRRSCDSDMPCLPGVCVNGRCYEGFGGCTAYPP
jgi:hypothetical protein